MSVMSHTWRSRIVLYLRGLDSRGVGFRHFAVRHGDEGWVLVGKWIVVGKCKEVEDAGRKMKKREREREDFI